MKWHKESIFIVKSLLNYCVNCWTFSVNFHLFSKQKFFNDWCLNLNNTKYQTFFVILPYQFANKNQQIFILNAICYSIQFHLWFKKRSGNGGVSSGEADYHRMKNVFHIWEEDETLHIWFRNLKRYISQYLQVVLLTEDWFSDFIFNSQM